MLKPDVDLVIPAEPGCTAFCRINPDHEGPTDDPHPRFYKLPVIAWHLYQHEGIDVIRPVVPDSDFYVEAVRYPSGIIVGESENAGTYIVKTEGELRAAVKKRWEHFRKLRTVE